MCGILDSAMPLLHKDAFSDDDGGVPLAGVLYMISVGHTAAYWKTELVRVFIKGNFSSLTKPPTKDNNVEDNLAQVDWSYVMALRAIQPLVDELCTRGSGTDVVHMFYVGMSDALDALGRPRAHGTTNGNGTIHELWHRVQPHLANVPGEPPIVQRRLLAFYPRLLGAGVQSPAATGECSTGAAMCAVGGLRAVANTSPQGNMSLLLEPLVHRGHRAEPLALSFLRATAQGVKNLHEMVVDAEANPMMRAHLQMAAQLVERAFPPDRWGSVHDNHMSLHAAYAAILGPAVVKSTLSRMPSGHAVAESGMEEPAAGGEGAMLCELGGGGGGAAAAAPVEDAAAGTAADAGGEAARVEPSPELAVFLRRSCISPQRLHELVTYCARLGNASGIIATAALLRLPLVLTSGQRHINADTISNLKNEVALAARSNTTVSAHIIAQLSGPFQQYNWANSEMRFNAQGDLTHLRSVVMSPLAKLLYQSHKGLWYVRAMDASFGFCRALIEVFIMMWVHPVMNKGLPLATFLRRQGKQGEPPLVKTEDLVWCERQLTDYFEVAPAAITLVDKCAASLKAHTISVQNTWAKVAAAPLPAPLPAPTADALPAAAVAAAGAAPADAPGAALAGCGGAAAKECAPAQLKTAADVSRALQSVATNCSLSEETAYREYMTLLGSGDFFKAATLEAVPQMEDGAPPAVAATGLFGQWGASHPHLVRPRAHAMDAALRLALIAVNEATVVSVQDIKDALSKLRVHCFALADTPLASFVSVCVLRDIVLCYFHAKKAMSEWNTSHHAVPKDSADLWTTEVKPAIDHLFAASRKDLESEWSRFKDRFQPTCGAFVEYMSEHWMSSKWRFLWTKAGRYDLAHLMVETTNVCELFFRVMKGNVLQWQLPTDR